MVSATDAANYRADCRVPISAPVRPNDRELGNDGSRCSFPITLDYGLEAEGGGVDPVRLKRRSGPFPEPVRRLALDYLHSLPFVGVTLMRYSTWQPWAP